MEFVFFLFRVRVALEGRLPPNKFLDEGGLHSKPRPRSDAEARETIQPNRPLPVPE